MLAGIRNALPVSAELAAALDLHIVMDLRGKWRRNVDAYRYVYRHYWNQMNHHVLAWVHPESDPCQRDYTTEFRVFCFWISSYADDDPGADPAAERAFVAELLANTPANLPVMGWPAFADTKGVGEYPGVRWLSEFGKFVAGTEFCSNLSVHTAVRPPDRAFQQSSHRRRGDFPFEPSKIYVSINVLDSGDALWYWQSYQPKMWADPARGSIPIGWCMNIGLYDALPLVAQWYYENATPNDTFFAAASGLGYMNTQAYAGRFSAHDREEIWADYVRLTDDYCRKLDIAGIELYNGTWGESTPPSPTTFRRFTRGMRNLDYLLADLGRHDATNPGNANYLLDGAAVFHTLTRFEVWGASSEVARKDMSAANAWLLDEIEANSPTRPPGFMSVMAISWYYSPSWFRDLAARLPTRYVVVRPQDLAGLFREQKRRAAPPG